MSAMRLVLMIYLCGEITLINSDVYDIRITEDCLTPNGSKGKCKLLEDCPQMLNVFANPPKEIEKYLEKYLCKSFTEDSATVCCTDPPFKNSQLPNKRYCGFQHFDDLMLDLRQTSIIEFPWIAAIMKKSKTGADQIACLGTLISNKYVITSGFCAKYEDLHDAKIWVRLGEFDPKNQTDCETWKRGDLKECNQHKDYDVEEIIPHPFMSNALFSINSIGLLRLNDSVSYSDYIRPICLQTSESLPVKSDDELLSAGWDDNLIKVKVPSTLVSGEKCIGPGYDVYKYIKCIKYQNIQGTSKNCHVIHNGAPVMMSKKHQWYLEGVSHLFYHSNGSCFARYTPLSAYTEWILQNLRV